ncbi:MAG: phage portal protein, partial [Dehalococcoidia bacterium]|nr:phage portal protein [Dehalococcoidia bacterium]
REEDVVQFRDGVDPSNPRKGLSPIKSLFREIFTDDEAANMTASLLRNMGVPGVIISPKQGTLTIPAAKQIKATYKENFSGDKKGEPMVMEGDTSIQQFGFSPEQMQLRALRGIPEERITSVLGINAAVVGLGAGLATTKVGATLREYREEAFESTMIPLYREMGSELTHQLLADFKTGKDWRVVFDLSKVRVLQDDENKRAERVRGIVSDGLATIAEGRRSLGMLVLPEHEVYLRRRGILPIPAGMPPEEQLQEAKSSLVGITTQGGTKTDQQPADESQANVGTNGKVDSMLGLLTLGVTP